VVYTPLPLFPLARLCMTADPIQCCNAVNLPLPLSSTPSPISRISRRDQDRDRLIIWP